MTKQAPILDVPMTESARRAGLKHSEIGASDLFGHWCLVIGA